MPTTIYSCALKGLSCELVQVEVDITNGISSFSIVGLGDSAIQEAKERVRSAIKNSHANFPRRKKTVNLAPADFKKQGSHYDLPIALGLILESGQIEKPNNKNFEISFEARFLKRSIFLGELALNGDLRPISGVLPITYFARERGFEAIYLPKENALEANLVKDIKIFAVSNLYELLEHARYIAEGGSGDSQKHIPICPFAGERKPFNAPRSSFDMDCIRGQEHAKRALEIAAAGAHHVLLHGPPGSGKTLLCRAFNSILPELTFEEALEITKIYSVSGLLPRDTPFVNIRPFRAVHHTASSTSIAGGGIGLKPGEVTLAHHGVLFLDELPEFPKNCLEILRQPLNDNEITVNRASGSISYPAQFILLATMNPCPCGYYGDSHKQCICNQNHILNYRKKISGPLLDRIDITVSVPRLPYEKLDFSKKYNAESSNIIRERVNKARKIQNKRFNDSKATNNTMTIKDIEKFCHLSRDSLDLLAKAVPKFNMSPRAYTKVLKISRTIADLEAGKAEDDEDIKINHVAEALQYRNHLLFPP